MKKILKITGYVLGSMVLLVLLLVSIISFKGQPLHPVEAPDLQVELTQARITKGRQISSVSCAICHQGADGKLSGRLFDEGSGLGTIYTPNLTQHPSSVMSDYSDGELYYLLRTGIKRDGTLALPMMLRMPNAADEELFSVIAFLRSQQPEVQAVANRLPDYQPSVLAKALFNFAFEPLPFQHNLSVPDTLDPMAYGKYLVNDRYFCFLCHSGSHETNDLMNPENSMNYLRGGTVELEPSTGDTIVIPGIAIEAGHRVNQWSREEFVQALRYGQRPDGRTNRQPMQPYSFLDSLEVNAIYTYLKNAPPAPKNVARAGD